MVELDLNQAGLLAPTITAGVLLVFSLVVGALCRFQGPGKWYAVFGSGFSLTAGLGNIAAAFLDINLDGITQVPASDGSDAATYWVSLAFSAAGALAAGLWTWGVIRLLDFYGGRPYRWMGWTAAALATAAIVPSGFGPQFIESDGLYFIVSQVYTLATYVPIGWMGVAAWILARARKEEWKSGQAILASALSAYPIAYPAWIAITSVQFSLSVGLGALFVALGSFLAVQFGWLGLRARGGGREAIAVTVVADLFLLLGIAMAVFIPTEAPSSFARVYDIVLVAYAILRLHYLDLDVKVRFGISKGTVAGVIVAVVFIVSEGAQSLFGEDKQWLGLAVGGLVVFAIAPLQRLADRLAETAIPTVAVGSVRLKTTEAAYVSALRAAARDGAITRREEKHLAEAAEHLGIGPQRALALREQVEGET